MKNLIVTLKSNGPMLMHSDKLVDTLSEAGKAHKILTSDRKFKATDEGKVAIAKSLYMGAFYLNHDGRIILPMLNIRKSLIEGARRFKLGKDIERTVVILDSPILEYDGPTDPEKLWDIPGFVDARTVVIGRSKVMAYRPVFHNWEVTFEAIVDDEMLDVADLKRCWETAGAIVGIGDFRPLFGRYNVELG
jgi:hypothetical protein